MDSLTSVQSVDTVGQHLGMFNLTVITATLVLCSVIEATGTLVGFLITVTKPLKVVMYVSEESKPECSENMTVVLISRTDKVALQAHSQPLGLAVISITVLVIWLVVLLTQSSLAEAVPQTEMPLVLVVSVDSVQVD